MPEDLPFTTKPRLWGHHCLDGIPSQTILAPALSTIVIRSIREQIARVTWPLLRYDCSISAGKAALAAPAIRAPFSVGCVNPFSCLDEAGTDQTSGSVSVRARL